MMTEMTGQYVELTVLAGGKGNLQVTLTNAGRAFLHDVGFDAHGDLSAEVRDAYDPVRTFYDLFEYPLANGWDATSSDEIGALISRDAPILSDSLERDDHGNVIWWRTLYVYEPYAILDPVAQLAKGNGTGVITFTADSEMTWAGTYIDITRRADGTLLLELTPEGKAWLEANAFEYPEFDEMLEDHLQKRWSYDETKTPDGSPTYTIGNPWDGFFVYTGSPQEALDKSGQVVFLPQPAPTGVTLT